VKRLIEFFVLALIHGYRVLLSPIIHTLAGPGYGCRFHPTCSDFALQAIQNLGLGRGIVVAVGRILRCRPGAAGGWDPPPNRS
jgi:hypothetical protein